MPLFKKSKPLATETLLKTKENEGMKKTEKHKLEFSIPKEVYTLMKAIEEDFDVFYKKVQHRKGIHHIIKTSRENYIANMHKLHSYYERLYDFFGVDSLQEEKVKKKYLSMDNTCSKYHIQSEISLDENISKWDKKIDEIIDSYRKIFNKKTGSAKHVSNKDTANFGLLLNKKFESFNESLQNAKKNIKELKKTIINNENATYYAEMNYHIKIIKECISVVFSLKNKLSDAISKSEVDFLKKHNSSDLPKILKTTFNIQSELNVTHEKLKEFKLAVIDSIILKNKKIAAGGYKLQSLMLSKSNYINIRDELLKKIKIGGVTSEKFKDDVNKLETAAANLQNIANDNIKNKGNILKYNKKLQFVSELTKFKSNLKKKSLEIEELVVSALSAAAAVRYALSPMRKVEKALKIAQSVRGLVTSAITTAISFGVL